MLQSSKPAFKSKKVAPKPPGDSPVKAKAAPVGRVAERRGEAQPRTELEGELQHLRIKSITVTDWEVVLSSNSPRAKPGEITLNKPHAIYGVKCVFEVPETRHDVSYDHQLRYSDFEALRSTLDYLRPMQSRGDHDENSSYHGIPFPPKSYTGYFGFFQKDGTADEVCEERVEVLDIWIKHVLEQAIDSNDVVVLDEIYRFCNKASAAEAKRQHLADVEAARVHHALLSLHVEPKGPGHENHLHDPPVHPQREASTVPHTDGYVDGGLNEAATKGDAALCERLLSLPPAGRWIDPNDSRELNLAGYGPLQEAAMEGHADCVVHKDPCCESLQ